MANRDYISIRTLQKFIDLNGKLKPTHYTILDNQIHHFPLFLFYLLPKQFYNDRRSAFSHSLRNCETIKISLSIFYSNLILYTLMNLFN